MKKRIFTIFGSGLIIGALFFGGYTVYATIQQEVGIYGCDSNISTAAACAWQRLNIISSDEAISNNPIFPKGSFVEQALMTGSLLYAKNGNNTDWRPLVTNAPDVASPTGILVQRPMYLDTVTGLVTTQRNARDSDQSNGLGIGSAVAVFQDGIPAGFDDWQGLRSTRRIGLANDGSNIPAYGLYFFDASANGWTAVSNVNALSLTETVSIGPQVTASLSTWNETDSPAAATQATASKAAGAAGVQHVATSITGCITDTDSAFGTATLQLRDGATGAGTVIRTWYLDFPAANDSRCIDLSIPAMIGTAATAMTLEFTAGGTANSLETVSFTGYSVQ